MHGKFQKAITITTDDPVRPSLMLRLEGEVKSALLAEPQAVGFGLVVEDSKGEERRVKLSASPAEKVGVSLPPEIPGRKVRYTLETKVPGNQYELVCRWSPPFTPGPMNESVVLVLDHPHQKSLEVRVSGTVGPRLALEPQVLRMTDTPEGQPFRGTVRFQNRGGSAVQVTGAKASAPEVKVTVTPVSPGRNYDLVVEVPGTFTPPPQGTSVTVQTDDPAHPALSFVVQPKPTPPPSPALLVGKPAPAFSLKTVGGKEFANASLAGKVTLLDFIAGDCGFCKRQIPRLATALKPYEGKPVHLLLVAQKMRADFTPQQIREVLKASGVEPDTFDLVVDMTNTPGKAFQVTSYPALVVIGKDGKVASAIAGNADDLEPRLKGQLDALLAGKPVPPSAPGVAPPARPAGMSRTVRPAGAAAPGHAPAAPQPVVAPAQPNTPPAD